MANLPGCGRCELCWTLFVPMPSLRRGRFSVIPLDSSPGISVPVYSIEVKFLFHLLARYRLGGYPDVTLIRGDSRRMLEMLARLHRFEPPIAYLDARCGRTTTPNRSDEILGERDESVIVIDDCQVPKDPGYGFDLTEVFRSHSISSGSQSRSCVRSRPHSRLKRWVQDEERFTLAKGSQGAGAIRELAERGFLTIMQSQTTA